MPVPVGVPELQLPVVVALEALEAEAVIGHGAAAGLFALFFRGVLGVWGGTWVRGGHGSKKSVFYPAPLL